MPSESFDVGLLSPVTATHGALVSDQAVLDALVTVEFALVRAWAAAGVAPVDAVDQLRVDLGWSEATGRCSEHGIDVAELAEAAIADGNPVVPLVGMLKQRSSGAASGWIHRAATSQDILDTALVLVSVDAVDEITRSLDRVLAALATLAAEHRDTVAAARTLTQHAVPTTWGARFAGWARGAQRAKDRLRATHEDAAPQLGGAAGTLAAFVDVAGESIAAEMPARLARELGLASAGAPQPPWHTQRWRITELGDALAQVLDALGVIAAGVALATRTEIGELITGSAGTSSAMPQKRNPIDAVLVRSAAIRGPQLAATLHVAAALAVDERPDGAWHAEWPTLREMLRLALGSAAHAAGLVESITVDRAAVDRVLGITDGLLLSEHLGSVLRPLIGAGRFSELVNAAASGERLRTLIEQLPEAADLDIDALLDPARAVGLAPRLADDRSAPARDAADPR